MLILTVATIMALLCPKCGGFSWVEIEHNDPIQKCICGLTKFLSINSDGMLCERSPLKKNNFTLPTKGTQLSKILGCLAVYKKMTSKELADRLKISSDKATTNLCILRKRGLIKSLVDRRGKLGGSTWVLEPALTEYYGEL